MVIFEMESWDINLADYIKRAREEAAKQAKESADRELKDARAEVNATAKGTAFDAGFQSGDDYILNIARKWVSAPYNVDGWRLDVAADLGHSEKMDSARKDGEWAKPKEPGTSGHDSENQAAHGKGKG